MTKDAEKMLCCLYHEYLNRIKAGNPKTSSRKFTKEYIKSDKILSRWHSDDFTTSQQELIKIKYLKKDVVGNYQLTDDAIQYMENRFKNNITKIAEFISNIL